MACPDDKICQECRASHEDDVCLLWEREEEEAEKSECRCIQSMQGCPVHDLKPRKIVT